MLKLNDLRREAVVWRKWKYVKLKILRSPLAFLFLSLSRDADSWFWFIPSLFPWKSVLSPHGRLEKKCGLLSAKGGLMMGTKKVGVLSSPQRRTIFIIAKKKQK